MATKPVQISMDEDLLARMEKDAEVQKRGRSAFVRSAVRLYLRAKERREVDQAIRSAYSDTSDALLAEMEPLIDQQAWPDE